jgi:hypothetical protein
MTGYQTADEREPRSLEVRFWLGALLGAGVASVSIGSAIASLAMAI